VFCSNGTSCFYVVQSTRVERRGVLVAMVTTKKRSADVVINFQRRSAKTGRMRRNSANVLVLEALDDRSCRIAFHGSNQAVTTVEDWSIVCDQSCSMALHSFSALVLGSFLNVSDLYVSSRGRTTHPPKELGLQDLPMPLMQWRVGA
jgi:hypothetical protein